VILTFFYYKLSFLIKSDGNLSVITKYMVQSCMFNFLFKLESSIEFDGFLGYKRLGLT